MRYFFRTKKVRYAESPELGQRGVGGFLAEVNDEAVGGVRSQRDLGLRDKVRNDGHPCVGLLRSTPGCCPS